MRQSPLSTSAALSLLAASGVLSALPGPPGQWAAIPSWDLQTTAKETRELSAISQTGVDTSSWHHVSIPHCTLMGCLLNSGVYNETDLFFSDNLSKVDARQFAVPWLYRNEFSLDPGPGKHYFLQTHGISSRADIFLNGKQVADKSVQVGSYAGHRYDITDIAAKSNALAIRVHPTNPNTDLAIGWVDWNPWPADNGTGVWRAVEVKQTGPVALRPLRVVTLLDTPLVQATYTLRVKAQNLEKTAIRVLASASVKLVSTGEQVGGDGKYVTIQPGAEVDIVFDGVVQNPAVWWPKQWGDQPLYNANLTLSTDGVVSDSVATNFGFRVIQKQLNSYNDTTFIINRRPFQVLGGGYAPDMFLRWDAAKWEKELKYVLDLGFNTVRLEGKNEHPELYDIADRLGVMIMAGWECCDKWEAWS
jgi:exo-1,4-beta-D-glucosaminidase